MKKKVIIVSLALLMTLAVAGSTFAWFNAGDSSVGISNLSTIQVETIGKNENVKVQNKGTGDVYVRVRLVPQWSDPSLSVSNVKLNLNISDDWIDNKDNDGYYYYKDILKSGEITSNILNSIVIPESLEGEYVGESFNVKVVSEGVQINQKALMSVWGIGSIPTS